MRFAVGQRGEREAILLNTAGGLTGGDTFATSIDVTAHALTVTTLACEKIYRSDGQHAVVRQAVSVADGARLDLLPQPTLIYDGARLARVTRVTLSEGATMTACEGLVFGRAASGESLARVDLTDRIEIVVGGKLAWLDCLRLDDATLANSASAARLGGARAIGLAVHRGPQPAEALARVRAALPSSPARAGASLVNGLLLVRLLAPSHGALQDGLGAVLEALTGSPPPRCWRL